MLTIKNISKKYKTGDLVQVALDNVSLNLRDNEFVSILGPSGSGKTTLLNIIGGLDRYDSGDLIINNVSTKDYKDSDWDSYRNHTIGFVFQSYNLIPHQTVLANVELALTIGGISKQERRKRALAALDEVGLKDQAHKKPNQMSGGQMQRVAIARALVNNPDILLADEPTGALDTQTSIQVMELLKKVAKDRLVVMVTHNPELAEEYSTRIVRLKDGVIIDDTDPYIVDEQQEAKYKNLGKASMSFAKALSLSFNNLLTKKGRTILTAFAGSIGIIGIALILSLSTGFQNYINKIQEDTLTSYPLTIYSESSDATSTLLSMVSSKDEGGEGDIVVEKKYMTDMLSTVGSNDLKSFNEYLSTNYDKVKDDISLIDYSYSVQPLIYTKNEFGLTQLNPSSLISSLMGGQSSMMSTSMTSVFNEMADEDTIKESYDMLAGTWPTNYDEVLIVLPDSHQISDLLVYSLGLKDSSELKSMVSKIMNNETVEDTSEPLQLTYDDLMNIPLKLVNASDTYKYNSKYNIYESMKDDEDFMNNLYKKSTDLKVVGIISAKEGSTSASLMSGVAYTKELTDHVIEQASESEIVKKQLLNKDINVFSNKSFDDESDETGLDFQDMISIDKDMLSSAFGVEVSEDDISSMTTGYMSEISSSITTDTSKAKTSFDNALNSIVKGMLNDYIDKNADSTTHVATITTDQVESVVSTYLAGEEAQKILTELETQYLIPKDTYVSIFEQLCKGVLNGYISSSQDGSPVVLAAQMVDPLVETLNQQASVQATSATMASKMTEAVMQKSILSKVGELTQELMGSLSNAFQVDQDKIAKAFQFNMSEDELMRLIETLSSTSVEQNADTNLTSLGYQNVEEPTSISFYFKDFESKERFVDFLDDYNQQMEKQDEDKVITYTDITGILMSSVKTIVDSVSYVLIAFVSISLIVSSIMIGIITYISVLERTKEIGVLRAIGASKKNISSIFNAETFIIGLISGSLGIGVTVSLIPIINSVIHNVTGNMDINAVLPINAALILVLLSVILTLISGLIPAKQAAKKDPVLALRSE